MNLKIWDSTTIIKKSSTRDLGEEWRWGLVMCSNLSHLNGCEVLYQKNYEKLTNTEEGEAYKIPTYAIGGYKKV